MNEEKRVFTATNSSRRIKNDFPFNVFKSKTNESLTHSLFLHKIGCASALNASIRCARLAQFFDSSRSKVIFRVTQKSPEGSFAFLRKPCSARLPTLPPAPDGCMLKGRLQAYTSSPDGHFRFGLFEFVHSLGFHNPKV